MLLQDAQNFLEFDPNFENALNLPFLGEKITKNLHLMVMHLFLQSRQMMLQLDSQRNPLIPNSTPPKLLFYTYFLKSKFYYLHFYWHQLNFSADDRPIPPWPVLYRLTIYKPSSPLA